MTCRRMACQGKGIVRHGFGSGAKRDRVARDQLRLLDYSINSASGGWMCCLRVVPLVVLILALLPAKVFSYEVVDQ